MKIIARITLLLFACTLFFAKTSTAQNYIEVGSGTVPTSMPIYSSWNYSWSSLIYNHADLGTAKTITKIGLNCVNGPKTVTNQKIYVKLATGDVFANANYEDPLNNGYTLVFSGSLTFQNGWNEIVLTTPIAYDGVKNIYMHWEDRWGQSYGPQFTSTSSSINNTKNCGNDNNFPAPSQAGYLNPYPSSLTNMRFFYASTGPATPTNPVPADNATVVSVDTDLSWTLGANTTTYDVYFGTNPNNLPQIVTDAPAINGVNTYTIPGLLQDSLMHYWKVVAKNGTQTETSPIWKFKTEVVIDQFPYNEGFEDSLVFHTYPVVSAWVITPEFSWYQYDTLQHSGKLCAKTSYYVNGNSAIMRSPKVLLPPGYSISYYWKNTSANKIAAHDTTYFEVTTNGGNTWSKLDYLSPSSMNQTYVQKTINLDAYAGNNFFFRFRHSTDNSASADGVYVDDISIFQSGASPTLTVTPPNQNVTSPAGTTTFTVASNSSWTTASDQAWCTVTPVGTGNGTITATYQANTTGIERLAHITVTVAGITPVVVTVTQAPAASTLTVTPPNQNVSSAAGTTTFTVTSSAPWTASSNQTWCTVTPSGTGNGTITATYTDNTTGSQRIAQVTVSATGMTPVVVTVTQGVSAVTLNVTPSNQNVTSPAGTTTFAVTTTAAWTASSNQSWCTVTPSGTGNGTITATYTDNTTGAQRIAQITVTVSGLTPVVVTVTQAPATPTLSVTPSNQNVNAPAGTTTFTVTTASAWTASSNQSWCTVTPSGTGNGTITATFTENTTGAQRLAQISVTVAGLAPVQVTVTQAVAPATLAVTPPNQDVTALAGTTTFSVTSTSAWTVSSNQAWCTVTPSGTGNGTITATYTENPTFAQRIASITVTVAGLAPVSVTVTQEASAPYLNANPSNQNVTAPAGTTNFTVNSNMAWTATSDAGWCAVTGAGTGSGVLFATYAENTVATTRVAHITLNASGLTPVALTVTQSGPNAVLTVTPAIQNVDYHAGVTTFAVSSNTNWTATSDASWCVPTASGTGSGIISATYTNNASQAIRTANITVSAPGVTPVIVQVVQSFFDAVGEFSSSNLSVYPNPAHDQVNIVMNSFKSGSFIEVFDISGNKVAEKAIIDANTRLDVSTLAKGIYTLKVSNGNAVVYKKIVTM